MKQDKILQYQNKTLKALAGKIDDFYLAGGTALSLFYFQHRRSIDLDFFTGDFAYRRIKDVIKRLGASLKKDVKIIAQNLDEKKVRIVVSQIDFGPKEVLKIDFVEDTLKLIKKPRMVEGINILSLEDIYLRKIYCIVGMMKTSDEIGRDKFVGGRREAKDFCDLYFLSHTFMPLARFAERFGDAIMKEGLIKWFRTFDRMEMMDGIPTLDLDKRTDYKNMEKHFKREIDKIVESELDEV